MHAGNSPTSMSLLQGLIHGERNAWGEFDKGYRDWMAAAIRRLGFDHDVDEIVQQVMMAVYESIGTFRREREGAFRAWVREIIRRRVLNYFRSNARPGISAKQIHNLNELEDGASEISRWMDAEHNKMLIDRVLAFIKTEFSDAHLSVFKRTVLQQQPAAQVADDLCLTPENVYIIRFRIQKRLNELANELLA
jgi:RNA polymerase sigma factor (sigma-70 family)